MRSILGKIVIFMTILGMLTLVINIKSFASDQFEINEFLEQSVDAEVEKKVTSVFGAILAITRVIIIGVAITMLIFLGMKYVVSSAGERAEIKKHATIYVVGAVVLFAASGILAIIENFANTNIG